VLPPLKQLDDTLRALCHKALSKLALEGVEAEVVPSTQDHFGHYQCNNALKLAKRLKCNPRDLAAQIQEGLDDPEGMIAKTEIAGPGFINIFLSPEFLSDQLNQIFNDPRLGIPLPEVKERIIVEFSSPNIAKELHVGHLRSTIIGDAIARLFEFLGHDVIRLNHVGDWGTQFGMLIAYLKAFQPDVLTGSQEADLKELMNWYRESKAHFDADPDFKDRARKEVVKLQGGEADSRRAWETICEISRKAFSTIYNYLDVDIEERGESFYNPMLKEIVERLEKQGLVTVSDGAKCLFLDGFVSREGKPLPMIVQKSDGGYNYSTTDMAAMDHRANSENANRIIVVTDAGQQLHFQMILAASKAAKTLDPEKVQFDHVPFGVVLGPDGKKFKTRSGTTEPLLGLLLEAIERAKTILKEKNPNFSDAEIEEMAQILGIDAVKYADLSSHRLKDYIFSYDRMLNFEGNTAAYLLYSYVRIQGIKRKVGKAIESVAKEGKITLAHPSEIALGLHLLQFGETLRAFDRDLLPNRLTDYLYNLAEKFHAFFRDCRVEGTEFENSRLLLCDVTGRLLKQGLQILGLATLDRM